LPPDPNQPVSSGVIDVPVSAPTAGSFAQPSQSAAAPQSQDDPASSAAPGAPRPRRWLIYFAILATAVLCVVTIAMLYLQWWRTEPRNSIIVVWGEPGWEGATAEVTGPALPPEGLKQVLRKEHDLLARFHVPSGVYVVRVYTTDKSGRVSRELVRRARDPMRPIQPGGIWWPFRAPPGVSELGLDK
jgi:hypothetical protein